MMSEETPFEKSVREFNERYGTHPSDSGDGIGSFLPKREPQPVPPSSEDMPDHTLKMYGAAHIGRMSRKDLTDEIMAHQADQLAQMDEDELRHHVMNIRLREYQRRLHLEAHDTGHGWNNPFIRINPT